MFPLPPSATSHTLTTQADAVAIRFATRDEILTFHGVLRAGSDAAAMLWIVYCPEAMRERDDLGHTALHSAALGRCRPEVW